MSEKRERKLLVYQKPEIEITPEQAEVYYTEFLETTGTKKSFAHLYSDFPSPPSFYFRSMLTLYSLTQSEEGRQELAEAMEYLAFECIPDDVEHGWLKIAAGEESD